MESKLLLNIFSSILLQNFFFIKSLPWFSLFGKKFEQNNLDTMVTHSKFSKVSLFGCAYKVDEEEL